MSMSRPYDDVVYDEEDYEQEAGATADASGATADAEPTGLAAVVEALTVTSRRLAELSKSRGFYKADKSKGKNDGKGKGQKGLGKGKSKGSGKNSDKGKGKGKGKPSPSPTKRGLALQRKAIDESLCLGCMQPGHWLRDCPHTNTYTAQLTTVGTVLDAEGTVMDSWMVSCDSVAVAEKKELTVTNPDMAENDIVFSNVNMDENDAVASNDMVHAFAQAPNFDMFATSTAIHDFDMSPKFVKFSDTIAVHEVDMAPKNFKTIESTEVVAVEKVSDPNEVFVFVINMDEQDPHHFPLYDNPKIFLQNTKFEGGVMIADTGCQRQVAGVKWHQNQQQNIKPLQVVPFKDSCSFSFGPHGGMPATARFAYPAGLGGAAVALGVSQVECDAPALFSRPAFEALGAVPDICKGIMHYRALNCSSKLYLAHGHLAIRIDEWPSEPFDWPMSFASNQIEDVWIPGVTDTLPLKPTKLQEACEPVRKPPHADHHVLSSMAEQLALPHDELPGDAVHNEVPGALLRGHVNEAQDQGQNAGYLLSSPDCGDHAEDCHSSSDAKKSGEGIPLRSGQMQAPGWSEKIWCGRQGDAHVRQVRGPLDRVQGQGQELGHVSAKGTSYSQDSVGPAEERLPGARDRSIASENKPSQCGDNKLYEQGIKNIGKGFGKFIGWLAAIAAIAAPNADTSQSQAFAADSSEVGGKGHGRRCEHAQLRQLGTAGGIEGLLTIGGGGIDALPQLRTTETPPSSTCATRDGGGRAGGERVRGASMASQPDNGPPDGRRGGARELRRGADRRSRAIKLEPNALTLHSSADRPLGKEDRGWHPLRSGLQKRLLGTIRSVRQWLTMEARLYGEQAARAHALRQHRCDLVEIYGGYANITAEGLRCGLRALQPVDRVYGLSLDTKKDHQELRQLLLRHRPFLTVWEIRCDPWSRIQHLNYNAEQLEELRQEHRLALEEMSKTIMELKKVDCHFLLENPWGTEFWEQDALQPILQLPDAQLQKGSMCNFGLRGREGYLLKKDTGWCSDLAAVLKEVAVPCPGQHQHEECLGGNAKRAQIYTKKLARAVVKGLLAELRLRGDERFIKPAEDYALWTSALTSSRSSPMLSSSTSSPTSSSSLTLSSTTSPSSLTSPSTWTSTTMATIWYADISRDVEAWRPIMKETAERLHNKVQTTATVKEDTAFYEQITQLVPWKVKQIQIARNPKVRRLPLQLMSQEAVTHRAAVLQLNTGHIQIETEVVDDIKRSPGARFDTPVAYAVFIFGEAPVTSYNPDDNAKPEEIGSKHQEQPVEPEDEWLPHQPGSKDITFPGLQGNVPKWMLSVLMRVHVNLGHPGNEALVRHLAQAGASGEALLAAKHLKCQVCMRTRPPATARPAKVFQAKRFNDRLMMDLVLFEMFPANCTPF